MESYIQYVFFSWLPLLGLTVILLFHGKVEIPILKGIFGIGARCMDKRVPSEGWQLPGGAYALGLPIIWGGVTYFCLVLEWEGVAKILGGFVLYQFFFASPLFAIGLLKVFLHGLLSDVAEFRIEVHSGTCKAVVATDPVALIFFFIGQAIPGKDPFESLYDLLTTLHWVDVVPFLVLGNIVGNLGRLIRKFALGRGPYLIVKPGWSTMAETLH